MRRVLRTCLTVSLAVLFMFVLASTLVRAADYEVGVKVGDWVKYGQVTTVWSENGTEPSYIRDQKKIDWARVDIVSVQGTSVSLNITVHLGNGTQMLSSRDLDVSTNELTLMDNIYIIASNLGVGDPINNQSYSITTPTINQTLTRQYAGADRAVNFVDYITLYQNSLYESEFYFDRTTGILLESHLKSSDPNNSSSYVEYSLKATETNIWSPFGTTILIIIAGTILFLVALIAIVLLRRRKLQHSRSSDRLTSPDPRDS